MNPILITAQDLCAYLDANPQVEARALLARGRILQAREVVLLCIVARAPHVSIHFVNGLFAPTVARIMTRWNTPGRATTEAHSSVARSGDSTVVARPGADTPAAPLSSSQPPAAKGAGTALAGGTPEEATVAWTRTWFRDGREVRG